MALLPVSVIVPTRGEGRYLEAAIRSLAKTEVREILIVSKARINLASLDTDGRIKILVRPEAGLSEARNIGISESSSGIIAFTDDDCTVAEDWPQAALDLFRDPKVGAVGGPGLTEPEDSWKSKCSGAVLYTRLGTANSVYRYRAISDRPKAVGEKQLSTCNLSFRRSVLEELGYFTSLQTCEENELIERIRSAGYDVLYSPTCIVYHHRRPLFVPFLRQISRYGKGRAAFILRFPVHLSPVCVAPSILVLTSLCLPLLCIFLRQFAVLLLEMLAVYTIAIAVAALISTQRNRLKLRFTPVVFSGIAAMHYCYGFSFIIGLFKSAMTQASISREERLRELMINETHTECSINQAKGWRSLFRER